MKIKLDDGAYWPTRAHDTDAGLDLYSREDKIVPAGGSACFDTGVHIELSWAKFTTGIKWSRISSEYSFRHEWVPTAGFLKSKSGLNVKSDITSDGVIDMGYTGPIVVKLYNHGTEDYRVKRGDKISQLVIVPVLTPEVEVTDALEETERGNDGFRSSGR